MAVATTWALATDTHRLQQINASFTNRKKGCSISSLSIHKMKCRSQCCYNFAFKEKAWKENKNKTTPTKSFKLKGNDKTCSTINWWLYDLFLLLLCLFILKAKACHLHVQTPLLHLALSLLSPSNAQGDEGASCRGRSPRIFMAPIKSGKWPFKRRLPAAPWLWEWPSERWTTRCHTWLTVEVCSTQWDHHLLWIAAGGSGWRHWRLPGWESSALQQQSSSAVVANMTLFRDPVLWKESLIVLAPKRLLSFVCC